jgi:hypothetical protein
VIQALALAFDTQPLDVFVGQLRRRLTELGVGMVDGKVVAADAAAALVAEVVQLVRARVTGPLAERPADALRVLDVLRSTGFPQLEAERASLEAERARRYPPPPPARWREIDELRALAASHPEHCRLGPPASHVEFAARLAAAGCELPGELLAFYAACGHVALACRHVAAPAGGICAGEALRVRDGRVVLCDRVRRHPSTMLVEQPGVSIAPALGTWWMVLEDEHAPATRRPLDVQGFLRFALRRVEAPSLEALLTELSWRGFFV